MDVILRIAIPPTIMTDVDAHIPFATSPLDEFRGRKKSATQARGCREHEKERGAKQQIRFTPRSMGGVKQ